MKSKDLQQILRLLAMISQVGLMIATSIGIGFFIGYFLDKLLGFWFIFTPIFILLGIGAGFWSVFKMFRQIISDTKKDE